MNINDTIQERHKTHGNYIDQAQGAQRIKDIIRHMPNWEKLLPHQRESLELIATKISRIGYGDHLNRDTWLDIEGYAKLSKDLLIKE